MALYPVILALNRDMLRLSAALLDSNLDLMRTLGSAIAKRDSDTDAHSYRVTLCAVRLAQALRRPKDEIAALIAGAFLHDVGKIGIPDGILLKPGRQSAAEFETIKTHVSIGEDIVGESKWLAKARDVVASAGKLAQNRNPSPLILERTPRIYRSRTATCIPAKRFCYPHFRLAYFNNMGYIPIPKKSNRVLSASPEANLNCERTRNEQDYWNDFGIRFGFDRLWWRWRRRCGLGCGGFAGDNIR